MLPPVAATEDAALDEDAIAEPLPQPPAKPKRVKPKAVAIPAEPIIIEKRIWPARRRPLPLADNGWLKPAKPLLSPAPAPEPTPAPADSPAVNIQRIVEALLFAAHKPMTVKQIQQSFPDWEQPDALSIELAIEAISRDYSSRPIALVQLASGYRFQLRAGMAQWVTRLFEEKPPRYSRALLETLAIIAYRQPVTRGEIEDIRGVSVSSGIIQTLLEREWIRVVAHKEVPGRPGLYGTTKAFLDYFNLTSLDQLPSLDVIADSDFSDSTPPLPQQDSRETDQTQQIDSATHATPASDG